MGGSGPNKSPRPSKVFYPTRVRPRRLHTFLKTRWSYNHGMGPSRKRLVLIGITGLIAVGFLVFRVETRNELGFLNDLHPTKIALPAPTNYDVSYLLLFPRETAPQVLGRLDRELPANGWRRTHTPGCYVYGLQEGLVGYRMVGPEPQRCMVDPPFTMQPGTCYIVVCLNPSWPIMMLRGWRHSH